MILNKYNEIMNGVTVDPEMKRRVMSAVSASIKEQSERVVVTDIPVRRKANRGRTVALISSIAAGVLVIAGAIFISGYLNGAKTASESVVAHNSKMDEVDSIVNGNIVAAETQGSEESEFATDGADAACETTAATTTPDAKDGNSYFAGGTQKSISKTLNTRTKKISVTDDKYLTNKRAVTITAALPFEVTEYSTGDYDNLDISFEMFTGKNKESFMIIEGSGNIDLKKELLDTEEAGSKVVTTGGTEIELYSITSGKVEAATLSNCAVFKKNGKSYLILFSDHYDSDVFVKVTDII